MKKKFNSSGQVVPLNNSTLNSGLNADLLDGLHSSSFSLSGHDHDGRYVRSYTTSNDNIDLDWGQSFKTFDPIPSGTPPEQNPNISLLSIGENFIRRKQLAFTYSNDNIYYRRRTDGGWNSWVTLLTSSNWSSYITVTGGGDDYIWKSQSGTSYKLVIGSTGSDSSTIYILT